MFINIKINWLTKIKYQTAKKKSEKRSGLKKYNTKRIKENLKVIHHGEKLVWTKNGFNSTRIRNRRNNKPQARLAYWLNRKFNIKWN